MVCEAFHDQFTMKFEALTTIDYVVTALLDGKTSRIDVLKQVKMIKGKNTMS